ncbi:MAG TPA: hypothetical protein PKA82_08365 [Pyrinomonadaceae bacterium]|nr:hypothetical protein [Pyrinomonadaceae bacterium]
MTGLVRLTQLMLAVISLCTFVMADVPSPESRHQAPQAETYYVPIAIAFATAGALLFVWLGRRGSKRS